MSEDHDSQDYRQDAWRDLDATVVSCRRCPRLVAWREEVAQTRRRAYRDQEYWGRPVPGFGDHRARVLIVGLAPGAHGANRTGRMFTGDSSGSFLYSALNRAGFASLPVSVHRDDGLALRDAYIGAVCRCAPPDNKPAPDEIAACLPYLGQELRLLDRVQVIVALGQVAFDGVLKLCGGGRSRGRVVAQLSRENHGGPGTETGAPRFAHRAVYRLPDRLWLIASYHPSRQNTQTGRLSIPMFDQVWAQVETCLQSDLTTETRLEDERPAG